MQDSWIRQDHNTSWCLQRYLQKNSLNAEQILAQSSSWGNTENEKIIFMLKVWKEIYPNEIETDLTHLLYIYWTKCVDKDNTNYTVPLLLKWMKILNYVSFTYQFQFLPSIFPKTPSPFEKRHWEPTFFKPKGLLWYFWIQFDLIHFDFLLILVLSILFWTILGIKHAQSLGLPKKLFDNFENMYVSELDSK